MTKFIYANIFPDFLPISAFCTSAKQGTSKKPPIKARKKTRIVQITIGGLKITIPSRKIIIPINPIKIIRVLIVFFENLPAKLHPKAIPMAAIAITIPATVLLV